MGSNHIDSFIVAGVVLSFNPKVTAVSNAMTIIYIFSNVVLKVIDQFGRRKTHFIFDIEQRYTRLITNYMKVNATSLST